MATHHYLEVEPDKRAGTVSKTDRSALRNGEHALRLPPISPAWMDKESRRFCKAEDAGALPAAGSISLPREVTVACLALTQVAIVQIDAGQPISPH